MTPGRLLIAAGLVFVLCGVLWELGVRAGRLPLDIFISGKNVTFYFPLGTSLLLSVLVPLLLWFIDQR